MAGMTSRVIKSMPRTATSWDIRPSRPQKIMDPGSTTSMMRASCLIAVSGNPDTVMKKLQRIIDVGDPGSMISRGREALRSHEVAARGIGLLTRDGDAVNR